MSVIKSLKRFCIMLSRKSSSSSKYFNDGIDSVGWSWVSEWV